MGGYGGGELKSYLPYIFDARCVKCHKALEIEVTVLEDESVNLKMVRCKKHPQDSVLLMPPSELRKDLIYVNRPDLRS